MAKREHDQNNGGEVTNYVYDASKIRKYDDHESLKLRLLVVGQQCPAVVGRGAENLKRLKQEYFVKITGLNQRTTDRAITIEGTRKNCINCLREIMTHCTKGPYFAHNFRRCSKEINLLLAHDCVGSIVGKGGAQIKELSDQSRCKLKAYPDCLPNSNEQVVAIGSESEEKVIGGLERVLDIVTKFPSRMRPLYYEPDDSILPMGVGMVGPSGGGMGGMRPPNQQMGMGTGYDNQMGMGPKNQQMGPGPNNQMGPGYYNQMGMGRGNNQMNNQMGMGPNNQMRQNQGGMGMGQGADQGYNDPETSMSQPEDVAAVLIRNRDDAAFNRTLIQPDFQQQHTRTEVSVQNEMCGSIIGTRGSNLRNIRETSGAKVEINHTPKNSKENRTITIEGTQEQVQIAEQLMMQCARGLEPFQQQFEQPYQQQFEQPYQQQYQQY